MPREGATPPRASPTTLTRRAGYHGGGGRQEGGKVLKFACFWALPAPKETRTGWLRLAPLVRALANNGSMFLFNICVLRFLFVSVVS